MTFFIRQCITIELRNQINFEQFRFITEILELFLKIGEKSPSKNFIAENKLFAISSIYSEEENGLVLKMESRFFLTIHTTSMVYRQLGDFSLGQGPVGGSASWRKCYLGEVPVGGL